MKKDKSASAYTKIWMNRHRDYWDDKDEFIRLLVKDAPKIVKKGVVRINERRRSAYNQRQQKPFPPESEERMKRIYLRRFRNLIKMKALRDRKS